MPAVSELILLNRQRTRAVNLPLLRRIAHLLLRERFGLNAYALGVHLVGAPEMSRMNRQFLNHDGCTDVLTFDHGGPAAPLPSRRGSRSRSPTGELPSCGNAETESTTGGLHGETFICVDTALAQARQFRSTWQSELVRYLVHGALHLRGYDDLQPIARRLMKREENRLVRLLSRQLSFKPLATSTRSGATQSPGVNRRLFPLSKSARKPKVRS